MSLTAHLIEFLQAEGLEPETLPPSQLTIEDSTALYEDPTHALRLPMRGKNGEWLCLLRVFEQTERIVVYSIFPRSVASDQRARLALMLTRINYGLVLGNFEMDLDDGEIRYKTSLDVEGLALSQLVIRNLVYGNFYSMDLYYQALHQAMDTDADILRLVYDAEHPDEKQPIGFDLVDEIIH